MIGRTTPTVHIFVWATVKYKRYHLHSVVEGVLDSRFERAVTVFGSHMTIPTEENEVREVVSVGYIDALGLPEPIERDNVVYF